MSKERSRVSRRELDLLCRYSLAALNLPHGHTLVGAQMVAAAEWKWGTGLCWLLGNVEGIREAGVRSVLIEQSDQGASIDAFNENLLAIAPAALDYVAAKAIRSGCASLRVSGVAGFPLALTLGVCASMRQLESIVTIRYSTSPSEGSARRAIVMPLMATVSQDAGLTTSGPVASFAPNAVGEVYLSVTSVPRPSATSTNRSEIAPSGGRPRLVPDDFLVDRDAWSELLDLVGGILPPDGRGHLTPEEESDLHEAGPGHGMLHDDD